MILLIDLQAVAVSVDQISKRWDDIDWVTSHRYHFFSAEGCRARNVLRIVRLGDPDQVCVACYALTTQTHHSFETGVFDPHTIT